MLNGGGGGGFNKPPSLFVKSYKIEEDPDVSLRDAQMFWSSECVSGTTAMYYCYLYMMSLTEKYCSITMVPPKYF